MDATLQANGPQPRLRHPDPPSAPPRLNPTVSCRWLEQRGNANLNALVQQYNLNGTLRCLNESTEGCGRRRARALLR